MKELHNKTCIYENIAGTIIDLGAALCFGAVVGGCMTAAEWTVYATIALTVAVGLELLFAMSDKLYTTYVILTATIIFIAYCILLFVPAVLIHGTKGLKKFYKSRARRFVKQLLS